MRAAERLRGSSRTSPNLNGYRPYPADGAIVRSLADGGTYRFAGGAPLWISSCGYAPTCAGRFDLNNLADTAHIRAMPADGTVVRNVNDGGFYRFAGGAPLFVRCDMGAGCTAPTMIDGQTMAKLGTYTPATPRMRQFPPDGVVVVNGDDNQHYRFAGGAPLPIAAPAGAKQIIDARTLVQQGTATAALPHMRPNPADGTFLTAGGGYWRVAGGAAVTLHQLRRARQLRRSGARGPGHDLRRRGRTAAGRPARRHRPARDAVQRAVGDHRRPAPSDVRQRRRRPGRRRRDRTHPGAAEPRAGGHHAAAEVRAGHLERLQGLPPLHALHVAEGARRARRARSITVTCSGKRKGCPFKKAKQYRLKGSSLNIYSRWFKKAKLRSGATVVVRVSSPSGDRKQMTFKIRSRKLPVRTTRCSAAGGKLGKCA